MARKNEIEWYIREYIAANGVCEKTKFPVQRAEDSPACSGSDKKSRIRKAEKNVTQATHECSRTVNNNFFTGRDYFLTATLSDAGKELIEMKAGTSWEDDPDAVCLRMRAEFKNWVRRARRSMKETEAEIKCMAWVSDLDGHTLQPARPHIHVIVNAEGAAALERTWGMGYVYGMDKTLYSAHQGDLTDLVEYLMAQSRQIGTKKRYIPSRNLEKIIPSRPRLARNPDAPLLVPKGATLILKSEQRAGRPQKIRYYRPEKDRRAQYTAPERTAGGSKGVMRS